MFIFRINIPQVEEPLGKWGWTCRHSTVWDFPCRQVKGRVVTREKGRQGFLRLKHRR